MEVIPKYITDMCEDLSHFLPPNPPDPTMCCSRGCVPCIYDYYRDNLKTWKESLDHKIEDSSLPVDSKKRYSDLAEVYLQETTT